MIQSNFPDVVGEKVVPQFSEVGWLQECNYIGLQPTYKLLLRWFSLVLFLFHLITIGSYIQPTNFYVWCLNLAKLDDFSGG